MIQVSERSIWMSVECTSVSVSVPVLVSIPTRPLPIPYHINHPLSSSLYPYLVEVKNGLCPPEPAVPYLES